MEVPPDLVALGNMPVDSRGPSQRRHGYDLVSFQPTPPMPTYLLGLAVGHLRGVSHVTGDFGSRCQPFSGILYSNSVRDGMEKT